jgi:hypothetical protein
MSLSYEKGHRLRRDAELGNGPEGTLLLAEGIHHGIMNNCIEATMCSYRDAEERQYLW